MFFEQTQVWILDHRTTTGSSGLGHPLVVLLAKGPPFLVHLVDGLLGDFSAVLDAVQDLGEPHVEPVAGFAVDLEARFQQFLGGAIFLEHGMDGGLKLLMLLFGQLRELRQFLDSRGDDAHDLFGVLDGGHGVLEGMPVGDGQGAGAHLADGGRVHVVTQKPNALLTAFAALGPQPRVERPDGRIVAKDFGQGGQLRVARHGHEKLPQELRVVYPLVHLRGCAGPRFI